MIDSGERFKLIGAVHLFLLRQEEILLLRRYNTGYEDGNYSVPAGHLDGGETVFSAACREAYEETGIVIAPADLSVAGVMHRKSSEERVDFFLAATKWQGILSNREPEKCDQLRWADARSLPGNMVPYVQKAIRNYQQGLWFDTFGW